MDLPELVVLARNRSATLHFSSVSAWSGVWGRAGRGSRGPESIPTRLLLTLGALALASCAHRYVVPMDAALGTDGVTIAAEDGSFLLEAGKPFTPHSVDKSCPDQYWKTAEMPERVLIYPGHWPFWLERGAKRVRVTHPSLDKALYGILGFCPVSERAPPSVVRSYYLQVPENRAAKAAAGELEVIFEPYEYPTGGFESWGGATVTGVAWVLFLSNSPFSKDTATDDGDDAAKKRRKVQ